MQSNNPVELFEKGKCFYAQAELLEKLTHVLRQRGQYFFEQGIQQVWSLQNDRDSAQERIQELSQRADPMNDGYALA